MYFTDAETPHLRLKVARAGARVWDWRKAGVTKVIGTYPSVSYDEASAKARAWTRAAHQGQDARAVVHSEEEATTVQDLFDKYVARKIEDPTRTRKPNESKANVLSQTRPLRDRYGDLPVLDLTREVIMHVVRSHHMSGDRVDWTVASARQMIGWIRSAWNWGQRNKVVPLLDRFGKPLLNPAASLIEDERVLRLPKQNGRRRGYKVDLLDEEIIALLRGLEAARAAWKPGRKRRAMDDHAIRNPAGLLVLEFCLMTGCRKSEAIWLYQFDIRGDTACVPDGDAASTLRESALLDEHKTEGGGQMREIFLSPEARRVLALAAEWRKSIRYEGPLVFPGPSGKPCSTVNHSLDTAIQLGGMRRRIVVQSLRSAYVNYACRAGVPIEVVSRNVGHSDVRTTEAYYREVHRRVQAAGNNAVSAEFTRLRERLAG